MSRNRVTASSSVWSSMAREAISAAAMTLSFSWAASALRRPAFSSRSTSSSDNACDGVDSYLARPLYRPRAAS